MDDEWEMAYFSTLARNGTGDFDGDGQTDLQEFLAAYDSMEVTDERNVLIQNHIPGSSDTVWIFNGYFDRDARCVASACGRKLRQFPVEAGAATLGVVHANPEVLQLEAIDKLSPNASVIICTATSCPSFLPQATGKAK